MSLWQHAPVLWLLTLFACEHAAEPVVVVTEPATINALTATVRDEEPLQPLPPTPRVNPKHAALGAALFADAALSVDGSVSCATCHPLDRAGTDGLEHSRGARGVETPLNTPTVYNVTFNFRFNWNGAYTSLEDELDAPVSLTLGTSWPEIIAKLRANPRYAADFAAAYPDAITTRNVRDAIARYLDTLTTPNARFDQYLRGDEEALSVKEREGYETFKTLGCANCHQGANVGGNMFQRLGVMRDYFEQRALRGGRAPAPADLGRYATTRHPADRYVFRVPSLRNVALTPPYFHDGSVPTLEQAVAQMALVQLGLTLSPDQVSSLVLFLNTLTGVPAKSP